MAAASIEHRNNALRAIKESLLSNKDEIFKALNALQATKLPKRS